MNKMQRFRQFYSGWRKWAVDILVIVIVIVGVRLYQQRDMIEGVAPAIAAQRLDGEVVDWQGYRGQPMMLHFWASWCPVCRFEEDSIRAIAKDYPVLTIASWSDDTRDYAAQKALDFPIVDDPEGEWAGVYGIKAVPATFIINGDGHIEFIETGYSSEIGLRLRLWWLGL